MLNGLDEKLAAGRYLLKVQLNLFNLIVVTKQFYSGEGFCSRWSALRNSIHSCTQSAGQVQILILASS